MFRWSTFENEAFSIVYTMARLDYLTVCTIMRIFADHNNLTLIFHPN